MTDQIRTVPAALYSHRIHVIVAAFICSVITFLVFYSATGNGFVALDDYAYVLLNKNLARFDVQTVLWAFTSFHEGNWHPLTMISLAADNAVWGAKPYGYHLTNVIIHSSVVFFVCVLFYDLLTPSWIVQQNHEAVYPQPRKPAWPLVSASMFSALFFGLHPLRVESVAWVSERKDVLCMLFVVLSLYQYLAYCRERDAQPDISRLHSRSYLISIVCAVLAQLSKPTAVTLPVVLCIIDWYLSNTTVRSRSFRSNCSEKIPFFVIALIGAVTTLFAQQVAMEYAPHADPISRILIAAKALFFYLQKTGVPSGLMAFYQHPGALTISQAVSYLPYLSGFIVVSVTAYLLRHRARAVTAIWLFYCITLLPMLGIIQVGGQWAADRYSYLPSLGLSLLAGAGLISLRHFGGTFRITGTLYRVTLAAAAAVLVVLSVLTIRQIAYWKNTETLATRIIDLSAHTSGAPYLARAIYRNENGRYAEALADTHEAMRISLRRGLTRTYGDIAFEQGVILKNLGRYAEALQVVEWGLSTVDVPPPDALRLRNELQLKIGVRILSPVR